jgi:hypothetical protein
MIGGVDFARLISMRIGRVSVTEIAVLVVAVIAALGAIEELWTFLSKAP